ncbi:putative 10TM putative phosphate transporter, cytosolic domain-containing protein [Helianthus annuus]|uniref:CSC1/OSCA1-like cytosolic domain-containing protein n=2 Tax=Helianthus annuus TaxID=4232 RepID=A0A251SNJ9_HELAN|nr:putative 10TM putative phosphate transporter, cytosolic domain-containing protein [Helianthus annuus]KAJ0497053.1 putative 10TM putative phosphate transporter, cytosolic domain-containing protein [Helianthus annuus]
MILRCLGVKQARHQAEKKKEEEAKAIALEAEKATKEAAEMAAAESQRKAAEALTASQGAVSKESGFGRLNKAPEGNVLKGAESALKMEESRLQIYNEVVGKGFASEMDSNREYSRQGMQMARRIKTITGTKESVRVFSYGIVAPVGLRAAALMSPEAKPEQFAILVRDIPASSDGQSRKEQVDAYFKNIYPETFYKSLVVTENKKSTKSTKSWKTVKRSSDELSYTLTRKKSTPKKLYRLTTLAFLASLVKRWIRLNIISNEKIDGLTPKLEAAQKSTIREKQQGADVEFFTSRVTAGAAAQSAHARMIDTWTVMDAP